MKFISGVGVIGSRRKVQTFDGFQINRKQGRKKILSEQNTHLNFPRSTEKGKAEMERNNRLTEEQVKELAKPLVTMVRDFYNDPKNMKGFLKWQEEKQSISSGKS